VPDGPAPAPAPTGTPRWGLGDAALGWLIAVAAQTIAVSAYVAATGDDYDMLPLGAVALVQVPLWLGLGGMPVYAATVKGRGVVADFGLRFRAIDAPVGFAIGVVTQAVLVPLLYVPILWFLDDADVAEQARSLTDRAHGPGVVLLVLIVVVGAPIVEELFYRGLLLRALERRLRAPIAVVVSAVLFGAAHFQLLQLPALVMFGVILAVIAQRTGRLGPCIWAHAGFNAYTVFTLLVLDR
jgi:membrane protease YdiL (CAAX protease family)